MEKKWPKFKNKTREYYTDLSQDILYTASLKCLKSTWDIAGTKKCVQVNFFVAETHIVYQQS